MLKSIRTKLSISGLAVIGVPILLGNSIAGAATLTESSCKKAKLTLAEARSVCLAEARKASPGLVLTAAAKAKCEADFDNRIARLNALAEQAGVACRFIQNGDGSVFELDTLLTWSGFSGPPDGVANLKDIRDPDRKFTWLEATTDFLKGLNEAQGGACTETTPLQCNKPGFAGNQDWRLPSMVDLAFMYRCDLSPGGPCQGFVDPGSSGHEGGPLTIPAPGAVWSANAVSGDPSRAWAVFSIIDPGGVGFTGLVDPGNGSIPANALAVRGGREGF